MSGWNGAPQGGSSGRARLRAKPRKTLANLCPNRRKGTEVRTGSGEFDDDPGWLARLCFDGCRSSSAAPANCDLMGAVEGPG